MLTHLHGPKGPTDRSWPAYSIGGAAVRLQGDNIAPIRLEGARESSEYWPLDPDCT